MRCLELGGGNQVRSGFVSIDLKPFTPDTIVHDLENGLPDQIENNSLEQIVADNVLEHINNLIPLMNDCYDKMKPFGQFKIVVPLANTVGSIKDPTHVRQFLPESFDYFDLEWDYERQPDYGIKKWHVESIHQVDQDRDYKYLAVTLRKP